MLQPGDTIVVEGGQTVRIEKPLMGGRGGEGVVFDVSVRTWSPRSITVRRVRNS
jgi:hypothetical protein